MPANILTDSYLVSYRRPPWHEWCTIVPTPHTAKQAGQRLGFYTIETESIITASGRPIESHQAVIRGPVNGDDRELVLGLIDTQHKVLTPEILATCWDEETKLHVETFGALGEGDRFFMSGLLDKVGIKGEDLETYLVMDCNYLGDLVTRVTMERPVCWNTLTYGALTAEATFKIDLKRPETHLRIVLADLPARYATQATAVREVMSLMQETPVTLEQHKEVTATAFPLPRLPKPTGDSEVDSQEQERYERRRDYTLGRRQLTLDTFQGKGKGMDISDTVWKSVNAVVEVIDWGTERQYRGPQDLFQGSRAKGKERAWDAGTELIKGKELTPA